VTRIAQTAAVGQVLADLHRGDLESFLGVPLDLRERGALEVAAAALSAGLYEQLVTFGRDRPWSSGLWVPTAVAQARAGSALGEAYQALRGFVPVSAWVAAAGLPRGQSAHLLRALWTNLADNAVLRVLADAPAETVEAARRELRRYGEMTKFTVRTGRTRWVMPLWETFAGGLACSNMSQGFTLETEIFVREGARLLWRWAADPSVQITPRERRNAEHFQVDLRPPSGQWARELASMAGWTGRALWRLGTGSVGPQQTTAIPLAQAVPHARVAAGVPAPFAAVIREQVGRLLGLLQRDTAGTFEARLASAQVVNMLLTRQPGLSVGEQTGLVTLREALADALYDSLGAFGRAAAARRAVDVPAPAAEAEADPGRLALESLPTRLREAVEGLTPAVTRLATGSWPVSVVTDVLTAPVDAFAARAVATILPDAPASVVEAARRNVVRLWDEVGFGQVVESTSFGRVPVWERLVEHLRAPDFARAELRRRSAALAELGAALQEAQDQVAAVVPIVGEIQEDFELALETPQDAVVLDRASLLMRTSAVELARVRGEVQALTRELARSRRDEQSAVRRLSEAEEQAQAAVEAVDRLALMLTTSLADWASGAHPGPGGSVAPGEPAVDAVEATVRRLGVGTEVNRYLTQRVAGILGPVDTIPAAVPVDVLAGLATVATAGELLRESSRLWEAQLQDDRPQGDQRHGESAPAGSFSVPEPFGVRMPAAEQGALRLRLAELRSQLATRLLGPPANADGAVAVIGASSWQQIDLVAVTGLSEVMRAWAPGVDDGTQPRLPSGAVPEPLVLAVRDVVAEAVRRLPDGAGTAARLAATLNRDSGPFGDPAWASLAADVAALRMMPPAERRALHDDVLTRAQGQVESLRQALDPDAGPVPGRNGGGPGARADAPTVHLMQSSGSRALRVLFHPAPTDQVTEIGPSDAPAFDRLLVSAGPVLTRPASPAQELSPQPKFPLTDAVTDVKVREPLPAVVRPRVDGRIRQLLEAIPQERRADPLLSGLVAVAALHGVWPGAPEALADVSQSIADQVRNLGRQRWHADLGVDTFLGLPQRRVSCSRGCLPRSPPSRR
jgi:hypothetical protein